jgi:hypothetical protein
MVRQNQPAIFVHTPCSHFLNVLYTILVQALIAHQRSVIDGGKKGGGHKGVGREVEMPNSLELRERPQTAESRQLIVPQVQRFESPRQYSASSVATSQCRTYKFSTTVHDGGQAS